MINMKAAIYIVRIAAVVSSVFWITCLLQWPRDYPLLVYAALIEFILLLTIGNLICELWKLGVDSTYYRYVVLPLFPIVLILDCLVNSGESRPVSNCPFLISCFVYMFFLLFHQRGWLAYIGRIYTSQVTDHLMFPKNRIVQTRADLVITEMVINGVGLAGVGYLLIKVSL